MAFIITNVLQYFGYPKFHIVTAILLELSLPSFYTLVHNSQYRFRQQ